ncbi:hypothetical protein C923_05884 [Plasmodium falciparum UGT5.1]|uniref:Uncharacterized protein n=11 Tax=Plasmodium falciparum TaxID=5833 RepID=Q8IK71_PLAF7|nr:probable protein, unknown function [Plasmodium falciparum 3D7]ETW15645.1 hypothetical protein PFFVO_05425 [Plasmodium falciparum Vietnam Oak-Knoll (FVO)]ETW33502.1 hypothetical protein PFTANZ_05750 [Plasmodium falciparum Tanzania (2000708)]ETW54442.1 hypothetical protein PFUGPA_04308 [Plasmodium falciparum Palo Alto/Uganda]ETW58760.1 hypothetical protein PFMC_05853 [Plasmodium falciparum CAMP/Malaysia]EUR62136.1 hypothetical protein PFBG_05850 [Plasmodium falciparum 7G8]EWC73454.1 hypothet|eukprot:XP_001348909.1 probable protein, unknown function [Plasmodium falciparum 3D7]
MTTYMNFISRLKRVFSRPTNCLLCLIFCMMSLHSYFLLFDILERLIIIPGGSNQKFNVSQNVDSPLRFTNAETELKFSGDHSGLEELDVLQNNYEYIEQGVEYDAIGKYEIEYIEQYSDERNIQVYVENYYENNEPDENQEKEMEDNKEQKIEDNEEEQMGDNEEEQMGDTVKEDMEYNEKEQMKDNEKEQMEYNEKEQMEYNEKEQVKDSEENNNINSSNNTMHNNLRIHKKANETNISEGKINKISSEYIIYNIFENVIKTSKEIISLIAKAFMGPIEKEEDKVSKGDISTYNYSDIESTLRIIQLMWLFDMDNAGTLYPNSR